MKITIEEQDDVIAFGYLYALMRTRRDANDALGIRWNEELMKFSGGDIKGEHKLNFKFEAV